MINYRQNPFRNSVKFNSTASVIIITKFPQIDILILTSAIATSTTIALSWTQSGRSVDNYTLSYTYTIRRCGSGPSSGSEEISDGNAMSFILTDLEEDSDYTITLTAISAAGQLTSNQISTTTDTAGITTDNDLIIHI